MAGVFNPIARVKFLNMHFPEFDKASPLFTRCSGLYVLLLRLSLGERLKAGP